MTEEQQLTRGAIEAVERLTRDGQKPAIVRADAEPRGIYDVWDPKTGTIATRQARLGPVDLEMDSLEDLAEWAVNGDRVSSTPTGPPSGADEEGRAGPPCIYYGRDGAVGVRIVNGFREWSRCRFGRSDEFLRLEEIQGREMTPRALWTVLRTYFGKALSPDLVAFFGKLKFTMGQTSTMEVKVGSEAYSRDVRAEITGENAVPDSLTMKLRVLAIPDACEWRYPVIVHLETNPEAKTVALLPASDALEDAVAAALKDVADYLLTEGANVGVSVIRGTPKERE